MKHLGSYTFGVLEAIAEADISRLKKFELFLKRFVELRGPL